MVWLQFPFLFIISSLAVALSWDLGEVPGGQSYHGVHDGRENADSFHNEWTVQLEGGPREAELIARELGYVYGGPVMGFPNTYVFSRDDEEHAKRSTPSAHTAALTKDRRVRWAEQLFTKQRVKRYVLPDPDAEILRVKRTETFDNNATESRVKRGVRRSYKTIFNDELWPEQWYMNALPRADRRRGAPHPDMNILSVYAMGYNGRGVRISVLDDGLEHTHSDLRDNYDPEISWDLNDGDWDPTPRYVKPMKNHHGTRCAGEIAMTANNNRCGVGVAWGAKVGGVRMLDGKITDKIEAEALAYACDKVDIYSVSWGPSDDGLTLDGPGKLAADVIRRCIAEGRGGKGVIYVWANGNGGSNDNCNCDGYTTSIYTIAIGSASHDGMAPWYAEMCSSTLAVAYSSGEDHKIATTDTSDSCTLNHTGTSAAAPLAAGIIALALQANPNLTWRDVQHLIVWTSEYAPLDKRAGRKINGVGLRYDIRFGFGLLNAGALVSAALKWTTVPEKYICRVEVPIIQGAPYTLAPKLWRGGFMVNKMLKIKVENCIVNYIEHVELIVNINYSCRGALEVYLTSPAGTGVQILGSRSDDCSKVGFKHWPLTSVATWGEASNGIWKVRVMDRTGKKHTGWIEQMTLVIHGTQEMPAHMRKGLRNYKYQFNNYNFYQEVNYPDNIDDYKDKEDNNDAFYNSYPFDNDVADA